METVKGNPYSHFTAKERDGLSFPARYVLRQGWLKGKVLDFGCGHGTDVEKLREEGIDITGYDPYYEPTFPEDRFDTILCFYVLNVLLPEQQAAVLIDVSSLLRPGGKNYLAVRRDLQLEGYRLHKLHQKHTYQCIVRLPFQSILRTESCEIYEYQHYTVLHHGDASVSPFFEMNEPRELLTETATAFAFFDKYPVSPGHALVVPKRLVANYFELSWKEQAARWLIPNRIKAVLSKAFMPDGYNVDINIEEAAGQTVPHVYIHIIPRYKGDVEQPRGGVRGVVPERKNYLEDR